jgi:hypothetical protein
MDLTQAAPVENPAGLRVRAADGRATELPGWARWMMTAGRWLWQHRRDGSQPVLVISVPARPFASVFAAIGLVAAIRSSAAPDSGMESLARLRSMAPGTAVRFRQGGVVRTGEFLGTEDRATGTFGVVRVRAVEYFVPLTRAATIEPLSDGHKATGRARPVGRHGALVQEVLGIDPIDFETRSSADVVVVGPKERLLEEMLIDLESTSGRGQAKDLLRPRGVGGGTEAHRTEVWSSIAATISSDAAPAAAVLDGSSAVLRNLETLIVCPRFIVLDRTSSGSDEAVAVLASHRALGPGAVDDAELSPLPPGVELVAFRSGVALDVAG